MNFLWMFSLLLSAYCKDLTINICALDDPQLKFASDCIKRVLDSEVIAEWNSRLGAFGQLTEMEVVRMICRENADMGGVIIAGTLEDYFGSGEKLESELTKAANCLEAALETLSK